MIKWQSIMSASVCIFLSVCSVLVDIIKKNIKIPFIFISKHIYDITFMTAEFSTNIENALKNGINASFFCFHITNVNTLNFVHVSSI